MSKLLYIFCFLLFAFLPSISFGDITLIEGSSPKTILCKEESPYVYISIIIKSGIVSEAGYNSGMTTCLSKLILTQTRLRNPQELQEVFFSTGCHLSMVVRLDYLEIKRVLMVIKAKAYSEMVTTKTKDYFRIIIREIIYLILIELIFSMIIIKKLLMQLNY